MPPSEKEPGQSDTGAAASSSKFLIDPDKWCNYKIGDPAKPIGMTESLNGQLVPKWTYDVITGEVAPVWPSQRHLVQIGPEGVEHTIRVIYDPETHAVIMRTVADRSGSTAPNSFELQRQAFLALSQNDPAPPWMPDGGRFVVGKTEIAHIPLEARSGLVTRERALESADEHGSPRGCRRD